MGDLNGTQSSSSHSFLSHSSVSESNSARPQTRALSSRKTIVPGIPLPEVRKNQMEIDVGFSEVPARVTPSVADVIGKHAMAFVKDGKEREAPRIPMCRLLHMELVSYTHLRAHETRHD